MSRLWPVIVIIHFYVPLILTEAAADDTPLPGVKPQLTISVDEYNPFTPSKGVVTCVLVNNSADPVEVSIGYDGEKNRLRAQSMRPLTLYTKEKGKDDGKRIKIKPGQEQVVFELPLDEILFQGVDQPRQLKERTWSWQWEARPEPPASPIHPWRKPGYTEKATFWAEIAVNDRKLFSGEKVLKVKANGTKSK
jgi:hypothetical protein